MANRQRLLEINFKIENLTDDISINEDRRAREQFNKRLSSLFDDRERLETEIKEYEQEITILQQQQTELENNAEQVKEIYRLMGNAKDEKALIEIRLMLRQQIQKILDWIKIYPLQEPYQEVQETDEPGIVKIMKSKHMDKVKIKFKGSQNLRVMYLKNYAELVK
jgi:predicted  nucleic acid-binding Zn-ribbon protein